MDLAMERKIVLKEGENDRRVYPSNYYYMELNTAKMLHDLNISSDISEAAVLRRCRRLKKIWTCRWMNARGRCGGGGKKGSVHSDRRTRNRKNHYHQCYDPLFESEG